MKPLHRIAIVLGVAQVAVLAAAARHRPPHGRPHRSHGCDRADHAGHGPHHHRHERHGGTERPSSGGRRPPYAGGQHGGPPPWMRDRLAAWHEEQHAEHPRVPADDAPADPASPDDA